MQHLNEYVNQHLNQHLNQNYLLHLHQQRNEQRILHLNVMKVFGITLQMIKTNYKYENL